jgi:hypothetical protein
MAWMVNHGDGRSLFLIDEFGKGLLLLITPQFQAVVPDMVW